MANSILPFVISFLTLFLPAHAQYSNSVVNNQYQGTQVSVPNPLPTLTYNCALLPSICENVQNWINQDPNNRALPRTFHFDTNNQRKEHRRNRSCPNNWDATHACPEVIQNPIRGWGRQPATIKDTWVSPLTALLPPALNGGFTYEIQAANGVDSTGLAYTCDEFPPATWVEGGSDGNGNSAETICAPQSISCNSALWRQVKGNYRGTGTKYPLVRSEQDWQGTSHSHLGRYARKNNIAIMQFELRTTVVAPGATPNAATIRVPGKTITVSKRGVKAVETFFHAIPTALPGSGVVIETIDEIEVPDSVAVALPTATSSLDQGKRAVAPEQGFDPTGNATV